MIGRNMIHVNAVQCEQGNIQPSVDTLGVSVYRVQKHKQEARGKRQAI